MTDPHGDLEQRIQAYVAGTMSPQERAYFEQLMSSEPELATTVEMQQRIEQRLRESFATVERSAEEIESWLSDDDWSDSPASANANSPVEQHVPTDQREPTASLEQPHWKKRRLAIAATIAASVALMVSMLPWNGDSTDQPFFEPRALAQVYREEVEHGFRPYYICEDEERFADTFRKRQDVSLRLKATPDDRKMLGLSYTGGLSSQTTAMLCRVLGPDTKTDASLDDDGEPVIVFVNRKAIDNQRLATSEASGLHVHRAELDDLVLYEVSPFSVPTMLKYLEVR